VYAWKQAECIKWPQGRDFTGALEVKRKSLHIGQFDSRPFSRHLCTASVFDIQALQVMQWKKSIPSPFPTRHKLQNGQWYTSLSSSKNLQILQKYCAIENPLQEGVTQFEATGWICKHFMHIISFVAFLSIEWSLTLSWQNLQVKSWLQQAAFSLQFRL
jgi:hypothetical protein